MSDHIKSQYAGLINPNLKGLDESATLVINARSKELISKGEKIYRFGLGQSPFPVPGNVVEALRLHAPQKDYLPVKGHPQLCEAVADFHQRKDGIPANPDCVMVGPGSKELLFLLQLVFNGEIIIVSPCWVSYVPQAKILGKEISIIHSTYNDKWHLTPALFDYYLAKRKSKSKPALMILNYPGNPDGVTIDKIQLGVIASMAMENNIYILSDEIYGQLHHQGKHISIAKFYPGGTIISSGLSKWCGAGGWRLGTFTFPQPLKWLLEKMAVVASETYTSVSAPIQYAAIQAFRGGTEIEEYLWHARKILSGLGAECVQILRTSEIKVHDPVGGFYLFLDFSEYSEKLQLAGIATSDKLCSYLLHDTGVALLPGSEFSRPVNEYTARMAYVDFGGPRAMAAARTTPLHVSLPVDFNNIHCSNVIEGVTKITKWIKKI